MTVHDHQLRKVVDAKMCAGEWAHAIALHLSDMTSGLHSQEYIDVLFQKWDGTKEGRGYNIYDAYIFALYHSALLSGRIAICEIVIGAFPCADKDIEGMNERLAPLGPLFKGEFWGGTQDEDGYIRWDDTAVFETWKAVDKDASNGENHYIRVPPRQVPLEVGYQGAAKSWVQIQTTGLARWPYGQDKITIILPVQPHWQLCSSIEPTLFDYANGRRIKGGEA